MDTKVADPLHGALLGGRYRIVGRLAAGGMATVYQARDERLDRVVAIKIIHPDHARDEEFLARLSDEAKTVARLGHPNVVAVYDQGTHEGTPYVVMEFVRGRTLREVIDDRRRLDPAESLAVLEQILAALAVAHRAGLVHRDVKPENVLIAAPPNGSGDLVDSVVKVADFGLAHAVEVTNRANDGQLLGTPEYVAPELVSDGRADARADVYSTGIVLFEMLTGRVPFDGTRPAEVAWSHVENDVPAPSTIVPGLPPMVDGIVERATRRDPGGRPRDAAAMLSEIQSAREDLGALAGPTRALAHPTVVVPSVGERRDQRPPWARLPAARRAPQSGSTIETQQRGDRRAVDLAVSRQLSRVTRPVQDYLSRVRRTERGRRQLTAFVVIIGILLTVGGWWVGFGRYTEAPKFTELTKDNAIAEATRLGFQVDFGAGRFSEQIPTDTVIDQQPAPRERIVKGGTVTLILSLGPERYAVPQVSGQSVEFALAQLRKWRLVGQETDGFSDTLPVGYVVATDPPAGQLLSPDSVVKIIIARGAYPVHVPTVLGKLLPDAENELKAAGFTVEVTEKDDTTKPKGFVLEQNPPGGQGLASAQGQKVALTVAKGPPGTPMPNLVGQGCPAAHQHLQALGYVVDVQGNDVEKQFGRVGEQTPAPNEMVQPGQQVQIRCGIF